MNRAAIVWILLLGGAPELFSAPVDMEKAKIVAQNVMSKSRGASKTVSDMVTERFEGQNAIYVVNFREGGWVMVSADDAAIPVLAFSDNGAYRAEDEKPDGFLFLVSEYMEQIAIARKTKAKQSKEIMEMWKSLTEDERGRISQKSAVPNAIGYGGGILLDVPGRGEIAWGQGANNSGDCYPEPSYNAKIPKTFFQGWITDCECDHPLAGCGAVAMGQVMWYWQWPKTSPYRTYNWDLMPYKLTNSSTQTEGDEVANLLRDCGEASNMTYACLGSFTTSLDEALTGKFSYKSVRETRKSEWTGTAWVDLIRSEITCGRPVIFYGAKANTIDKRHYFVVDGYHSMMPGITPDFFHVNFGWRGGSNGFFNLGNIYGNGVAYNDNQYALIGISPTHYLPEMRM